MPTYLNETFTGTDGANWSSGNWFTGTNTTGASATIQSNEGRMSTGTVGGGGARVSRSVVMSGTSDLEITGKIRLPSSECYPIIYLRCDPAVDTEDGYGLELNTSTNTRFIRRSLNYSSTQLGSFTFAMSASTDYRFRFRAIGNNVKVRLWAASGSEPGTWNYDGNDGTPLGVGVVGITVAGGSDSSADFVFFDDILVTSGQNSVSLTGSLTPAGTFRRNLVTKLFTGSSTATGLLTKLKVVLKVFTASVTSTGAFAKYARKIFVSGVNPSGSLIRIIWKRYTGSITGTGAFRKAPIRVFTGSVSTVGSTVVTFLGKVFGRPGIVTAIVKAAAEVTIRIRRS